VILSKMFAYCIIHKYEVFLQSSDEQFGFKKKLGCTHAIFALSQCVDYFVNCGSSVFMAALDATKAFDRVHHIKLCNRLIDKGVPTFVVKIIANWYAKSMVTVWWKDCQSALFQVKSGVRQGGVLSPILFNMYIDIVVEALVKSDLGCHVMGNYFGCVLYADDLILLSASVLQLQKMLDLYYDVGLLLDLKFNAKNHRYCRLADISLA